MQSIKEEVTSKQEARIEELLPVQKTTESLSLDALTSLPDLKKAEVAPIDLMQSYWTPDQNNIGESKFLFFDHLGEEERDEVDPRTGEVTGKYMLKFVSFFEQDEEGNARKIRNASWKMVKVFEQVLPNRLDPFKVTYKGKIKNKKGEFSSDNWSVNPLVIPLK